MPPPSKRRRVLARAGRSPDAKADRSFLQRVIRDAKLNKYVYLMLLPVVAYYAIFHYGPMYGIQIAFKDYSPALGFLDSPWVGFKYFEEFFNSHFFWRIVRNTLLLSLYELIFSFPAPIILALMLKELRHQLFKRAVQTITYIPHFISIVVIVGMMVDFLARGGLINNILSWFGVEAVAYLREPGWFRTLYIFSGIWQGVGWGMIIYLAAISNIDPSLYEAAKVDGASKCRQVIHITIPGIMPVVIILLILQMGSIMSVSTDKILLMYNSSTYETADVIGTYVYRKGLLEANYSYSAAIGLFNSVINFALLILANTVSRRTSDWKLW
ncbi:ABC transporter permease subunit [Paenibacillus melissococcoides]|uniref:ABC transporter permease subunit n=1 Tax=Paenibacillus melissococcoides TaxID=2912268 RepID=A0ABM9G417_9BACL|nr:MULTISPECIES: ABC transporter permease subunit [Paenibacillus]MEB9896747.1 ABC transporter permease subunit [Bacillus cereus]CAH8246517.1 ABC transporter permease subunit [Paenibacillus melissococcoides]CAH8714983.1 ABC transporter permease subunit [Paenibacillus melissococcoides]CAH8715937.1 ABC transporter permease subunit [Paenibacillus melissococcoides]GIO79154.1 sugar ABC transporter permease [Paenibacillus dendritiformis]